MWAVANIVERFSDRYDFFVVAGNRNERGKTEKVSGVVERAWNVVGSAQAYYLDPAELNGEIIRQRFDEVRPDLVFLNSVFSTSTIRYLQARKKGEFGAVHSVIAPCGELLPGALAIKPWKKRLFLAYARTMALYHGLIWRASFESESESIRKVFGLEPRIRIAADLTPRTILPKFRPADKPVKHPGNVKLIFLSRIDRKKNLHFLLERLHGLSDGSVELEIIGPVDDRRYWTECRSIIEKLPPNISVSMLGAMDNASALERLSKAHFFVLPTLSENFGYVCIEALSAGCPLIISDRTDWNWVEGAGAGWAIPLEDRSAWSGRLLEVVAQTRGDYARMSSDARNIAVKWLEEPKLEAATAELFDFAIGCGRSVK